MDLAESAEAIQAVWTGKDVSKLFSTLVNSFVESLMDLFIQEILIVASDKSTSGQSNVWIGELIESVGVFRFKQDSSSITTTVYPDSLQVSPVTPRSLVVVVSYDRRYLYVSRAYGRTWTKYETPSANFDPAEELHLSNSNPLHMALLDRNGKVELYQFMMIVMFPCLMFSSMQRTMVALIGTWSQKMFSWWNCKTIQ